MKQSSLHSRHIPLLLLKFSTDTEYEDHEDARPHILVDMGTAKLWLATYAWSLHVRILVNFNRTWSW